MRIITYDRDGAVVNDVVVAGDPAEDNKQTLRARAVAALATNDAFLALAAPTNAQTLAQVQRLTKANNALIRLVAGRLDTITGT